MDPPRSRGHHRWRWRDGAVRPRPRVGEVLVPERVTGAQIVGPAVAADDVDLHGQPRMRGPGGRRRPGTSRCQRGDRSALTW